MAVLAVTMAKPHLGKRELMESRAQELGAIFKKHGARVKIANVISGPNSGCIVMIRAYENFTAASRALQELNNDSAYVKWWRDRDKNPAADIVIGRDIMRSIYGESRWDTHPVSLIRQYDMTRDNLSEAVKLMGEVSGVVSKADVNVLGLLPVTGENMSSVSISYQFRSPEHFGEALDSVGTSEAFQAVVAKAAAVGTLRSAFLLTPL